MSSTPEGWPSDERILHLWDTHVAYETSRIAAFPLSDRDKLAFARAVLSAAMGDDLKAKPLPLLVECLAQEWDKCFYDTPGNLIDIGVGIRAFAKKFLAAASDEVPYVWAWQHEEDEARVISATQKAQALSDGGASASSVKPYSVALVRASTLPSPDREVLREAVEALTLMCRSRGSLNPIPSEDGYNAAYAAIAKLEEVMKETAMSGDPGDGVPGPDATLPQRLVDIAKKLPNVADCDKPQSDLYGIAMELAPLSGLKWDGYKFVPDGVDSPDGGQAK